MKHLLPKLKKIFFNNSTRNGWIIILVLLIFVILESFTLLQIGFKDLFTYNQVKNTSSLILEKFAADVVIECAGSNYRPTCYNKAIPKLMEKISMEDAFKITSIVQEKDSSFPYCHVLAHELSAVEVQKDPSKWKDVVSRCPSGTCSNGCIHGGFQERFRAEFFTDEEIVKLKPELTDLCEARTNWNPTGMEQASCYHALGHLTMYITNADIKKSLVLCNEFSIKPDGRDYKHLCYDGAFMQIFQPLEPEDFSLIEGKEIKKDELARFCKQFNGEQFGSCWSEGWPLFRTELMQPEGLVSYCSKTIASGVGRCYDALVHVMSTQFDMDSNRILSYCPGLPGDRKGRCFANAASRMIEVDYRNIAKAVNLCTSALPYDKNNQCFNELLKYSSYNYHAGSLEFVNVCNALPNPWKSQCLSKS